MQEYQNSVNLEYYKNVEQNSVEARKIRHDLANMVQTDYEIMENGTDSDKESAKKMLSQLKTEIADIKRAFLLKHARKCDSLEQGRGMQKKTKSISTLTCAFRRLST